MRMRKLDLNKGQTKTLSKPESFRRNTGVFPDCSGGGREVQDTFAVRFHHLLVSLEGSERSGCLKIESARTRSRSAILLYRGRVVGCVYGRKTMVCQHLAEDAHKYALCDLASPGNLVEAYELSEELVLCAAALFNGYPVHLDPAPSPEPIFEQAMTIVVRSGIPGCVVLTSNSNETVCIVYVYRGNVIAVHSATRGWLTNTSPSAIRQLVREMGPVRVLGALLPGTAEASPIGFSLTGLGDRPHIVRARQNVVDALTNSAEPTATATTGVQVPIASPFQGRSSKTHGRTHRRTHEHSTFDINV
jgi:hypothetical protein